MSDILFSYKNVEAFPVGSVFIAVNNTNPNELLGYGTWTLISQGRMIMGATEGETKTSTGGSMSKTITAANLPSHSHSIAQHTHQIPAHNHTATAGAHSHSHTISVYANSNHDHTVTTFLWSDTESGKVALTSGHNVTVGNSRTNAAGQHSHRASASTQSHTHAITIANKAAFNTTTGGPTSTGSVGSGSAFDITPAYLKLFVWQRTE